MAKQVITLLTDDLDGGEADRTVEFGLDGVNYTIDLSEKNAGKLRKALDPYLAVATRVGRSSGDSRTARRSAPAAGGRSSRDQNQAIREWANKNGYEVSERGRLERGEWRSCGPRGARTNWQPWPMTSNRAGLHRDRRYAARAARRQEG